MEEQKFSGSHGHNRWPPRPPWIILILVQLFIHRTQSSITCGSGIISAGTTVPRGDIVLEYGTGVSLEITCILDPNNEVVRKLLRDDQPGNGNANTSLSQRIAFFKNSERVSKHYVTIVNSTAAHLRIPDPPAGHATYYCTLLLGKQALAANRDYNVDLSTASDDSSTQSTVLPTSLETSGPPPLVSHKSEAGVCLNSVSVGYKPLPIKNFSCVSNNWVSLTCNWTKPENPVNTEYKLYFKLPGRAGGRFFSKCPTNSDLKESTCYWDGSTDPIYRQPYEYYYFTMVGQNPLGNSSTPFVFHHYANIIPASPSNIAVVDKTQSSAMLLWSVGTMTTFPRELIHKIEYKSQWDSYEHWHTVNISDICNSSSTSNQMNSSQVYKITNCREQTTGYYHFNITDLKYPFTNYDVRIYIRSSVARGDDKWSNPGSITLKTKPSIPKRPPRTDIGSFECVISPLDKSKRDIFVYWQSINDNEKNGDSFIYRAFCTSLTPDNKTITHGNNETHGSYVKFEGLDTNVAYNITVYSYNKEGFSSEFSEVYIPSESDKLNEPISFTKMAFDKPGVFELSWKNSSSQELSTPYQVYDYTIFWCESDKDRPYQCNGYMNWVHIPSTESCYNVTVVDHTKIYQFAISANRKSSPKNSFHGLYHPISSSSGMVWASCTVLHNKIVGKIKHVWIDAIEPTRFELKWKLDCSDRIGAVLGYLIIYCPVNSLNGTRCKEPMLNKSVSGEMVNDSRGVVDISDLTPYTTYMVKIALITKHGVGLHSDPLFSTTLEGAPDVQNLNISIESLSNTSVALQWLPPKSTNGIIRNYYVHYSLDDSHKSMAYEDPRLVNEPRRITVNESKCRLENLESYRTYKITVTACTTICSNSSHPIKVRTDVGLPGEVLQPAVSLENNTILYFSWSEPTKPAGPINYYQYIVTRHAGPTNSQTTNDSSPPTALAYTQLQDNNNNNVYNANHYHIQVPDCSSDSEKGQQKFYVIIRAVNNNPHNPESPYYGPWSRSGSTICVLPGFPLILHLVLWSCVFLIMASFSGFWGRRFIKKYKVMHNVQVVLPPTLNLNFQFDRFNNFEDNVSNSDQPYSVEDGHIIYDAKPADGILCNANSNVSSEFDGRNDSSASTSSERLPFARWSPATATTTITTTEDNTSLSNNEQLILLPSVPTPVKCENSNGSNSSKSNANDVEEFVPTIVPVLPFFTLPEPVTPIAVKPRGVCSTVVRQNSGYQDSGMIAIPNSLLNRSDDADNTPVIFSDRRIVGITSPVEVIDCLVGDQRRSSDKNIRVENCPPTSNDEQNSLVKYTNSENHHDQENKPLKYHMDDNSSQQQLLPSPISQQDGQTLLPYLPQSPQKQEQPLPLPSSPRKQEQSPLLQEPTLSPQKQLPSPLQSPHRQKQSPSQSKNCHDGYCGKQMMIVAAINDLEKNKECEQSLTKDSKTPYVLFDMVTAATAATQKQLDIDQIEFGKPVTVQPAVVVVNCGSPSLHENQIEVSTQ